MAWGIQWVQKPPEIGTAVRVGVPGMAGIFRYDPTWRGCLVGRWIWGRVGLFLQDPPNGRLADVDTCSCQHVGNLHLAQAGAEQLDLLDRVADEIWKSIHRRWRLHQRVVVGTLQPRSDGVVGDQEVASRLGLVPAAHGPQLQDGQALHACVLRPSLGRNALHASAVEA